MPDFRVRKTLPLPHTCCSRANLRAIFSSGLTELLYSSRRLSLNTLDLSLSLYSFSKVWFR